MRKFEIVAETPVEYRCKQFLVSALVEHVNREAKKEVISKREILKHCKSYSNNVSFRGREIRSVIVQWSEVVRLIYKKVGKQIPLTPNNYIVYDD